VGDQVTAEHLKQVVERLSDGIILLDRDRCCLYLNPEAAHILGQQASDLVGRPMDGTITDAVALLSEEAHRRVAGGEEVLLHHNLFAQGHWYEVLGRPVGEGVLIHFRDITERLQAESARRQSEERFRLFVSGVRDYALIMLDPKGQIASWNLGAERISGFTAADVMGKHLSIFFSPDAVERGDVRTRLEGAVRNGSYTGQGWFTRKDGATVLVQTTYNCLYDDLGQPTGFALVTRDITGHRRLEERLRTEQERLRLVLEAARMGTFEENLKTGDIAYDRKALDVLGLPPDKAPRGAELLALVHPDDRERLDLTRKHLMIDQASPVEFDVEYRISLPHEGKQRWLEAIGRVIELGTEPGRRLLLGILHDITKRHEADEFRKLATGVVAHDLRAPLSAIRLSSQTLIRSGALPERVAEKLEGIIRNTDRMARMVEHMLLYAQTQFGGGLKLARDLTNLAEVCRQGIEDARGTYPDSEARFEAHGDCHGLWDETRLAEVATNLIGNAMAHGEAGQPVFVVARDDGDWVSFQVHNLGPPIPPDVLPRIFEPFRRAVVPALSSKGGFGLGLYITREIVTAHDGTIEVTSSASTGTTFSVHLPRGLADHQYLPPASPAHVE
jgi:PAS domain S-box-containing protein